MAFKRSDAAKSLINSKKLEGNILPLNAEVISHYYFLRASLVANK